MKFNLKFKSKRIFLVRDTRKQHSASVKLLNHDKKYGDTFKFLFFVILIFFSLFTFKSAIITLETRHIIPLKNTDDKT